MENEVKEKNNKKKIITIAVVAIGVIALIIGIVVIVKKQKENAEYDNITLEVKDEYIEVNYGDTLSTEEILLHYGGGELSVKDNVDYQKIGEQKIFYNVTSENGFKKSKVVTVNIKDKEAPTIFLSGENITVELGKEADILSGVSVSDNYDEDLTDKIVVTGEVDTETEGTYEIKYDVKDSSNNSAETKTRKYIVKEKLTLEIGKTYTLQNSQPDNSKRMYTIELQEDGDVEVNFINDGTDSGRFLGEYYFTGELEDTLEFTLTHYWNYVGWARSSIYKEEIFSFKITDNNQFEDSDGKIYK